METEKEELFDSLNTALRALINNWKIITTKNPIILEEIKGYKEGALLPTLEKFTIIAGNAIQLNKKDILSELLGYYSKLYELTGETNPFSLNTKEHLSHTIPSKEVIKCLYILGAYAIHERRVALLKLIIEKDFLAPSKYPRYAGKPLRIINHKYFDSQSGEGDLTSFFDETRELITKHKVFSEWFYNDQDKILNSLIAFDFSRGLLSYFDNKVSGIHYHQYNNFMRFYTDRTNQFIRNITDSAEYSDVFGENIKSKIIEFLNYAEESYRTYNSFSWDQFDWKIKELGYK